MVPASLPLLAGEELERLIEPRSLVDAVARALREPPRAPPRLSLETRSWLGLMAAGGGGYQAVKIVGVYPGNPGRGLPLVRGVALLLDEETGEPLLAADATPLTGWRTAAATAAALEALGATGGVLGIIGSGVQAGYHARLLTTLHRYEELLVYSRRPGHAARFAARHGGTPVDSLERLLRSADVVVAATNSTTPVVRGEALRGGAVVASVGAPAPVRELDTATLIRARCIVADTSEGAAAEAGDYRPGLAGLVELGGLLRGEERCLHGDVAVYKSVGTPVLDYAILTYIHERMGGGRRGLG